MSEKSYKRQYRELEDNTKARISQSLKGRSKSTSHAKAISQGMRDYWETVPSRTAGDTKNKKSNPQPDGIM